jgi:hypothetical protein
MFQSDLSSSVSPLPSFPPSSGSWNFLPESHRQSLAEHWRECLSSPDPVLRGFAVRFLSNPQINQGGYDACLVQTLKNEKNPQVLARFSRWYPVLPEYQETVRAHWITQLDSPETESRHRAIQALIFISRHDSRLDELLLHTLSHESHPDILLSFAQWRPQNQNAFPCLVQAWSQHLTATNLKERTIAKWVCKQLSESQPTSPPSHSSLSPLQ